MSTVVPGQDTKSESLQIKGSCDPVFTWEVRGGMLMSETPHKSSDMPSVKAAGR